MLKMFHQHESAGSTSAYWESQWGVLDSAAYAVDARRHCEGSPLWKLVTSKVQRDRLFIDGGCGHGYWVKYLHDREQKAAGVDFAENTLEQIRHIDPELDVRFGDVRALPFGDEEVHVYFSDGVVEHFEDGPVAALREARRVVASDGWFLCAVPDMSPLRKNVLYRRATETHGVSNATLFVRRARGTTIEATNDDVRFFQYAFAEHEFRELLQQAGFDIVETFAESFVWGLLEVDALRRLHDGAQLAWRALRSRRRNGEVGSENGTATPGGRDRGRAGHPSEPFLRSLPRRILFNEDRSIPVLGRAVDLIAEFSGNLRMYVARPSGHR